MKRYIKKSRAEKLLEAFSFNLNVGGAGRSSYPDSADPKYYQGRMQDQGSRQDQYLSPSHTMPRPDTYNPTPEPPPAERVPPGSVATLQSLDRRQFGQSELPPEKQYVSPIVKPEPAKVVNTDMTPSAPVPKTTAPATPVNKTVIAPKINTWKPEPGKTATDSSGKTQNIPGEEEGELGRPATAADAPKVDTAPKKLDILPATPPTPKPAASEPSDVMTPANVHKLNRGEFGTYVRDPSGVSGPPAGQGPGQATSKQSPVQPVTPSAPTGSDEFGPLTSTPSPKPSIWQPTKPKFDPRAPTLLDKLAGRKRRGTPPIR